MDDKKEVDHINPVETNETEQYAEPLEQKRYLGQTAGTWYIYWICAVASVANIFQGFDSGIYTIIIADKNFINRFDITGSRQGAVASMISKLRSIPDLLHGY